MTDRIDLDELADESDGEDDRPNRGDWFWRDEGDPADEPAGVDTDDSAPDADASNSAAGGPAGPDGPVPHVPRENQDRPVGIPMEGGGAGGAPAKDRQREDEPPDGAPTETLPPGRTETGTTGGGPHGGGVDDMTMALTYRAARRLADPAAALADASRWADWLGIVGEVEAHVINKFQRDHGVDVDFFNGSGTGPGERLVEIDEHSMFFAERMVVVGLDGEEDVAATAGWEFVPLPEAATKADWTLAEADANADPDADANPDASAE